MLIAQIKSIKKLLAIEPDSVDDLRTDGENQEKMLLGFGDNQPNQPEKGRAILEVELMGSEGVEAVEDIFIIGQSPMKAKLLKTRKLLFGGLELDLYFDRTFVNGFANTMQHFLFVEGGLVGTSPTENATLGNRLEVQRRLFEQLADMIMTTKKEEIKRLALPCLLLKVTANGEVAKSHLVGPPQIGKGSALPTNAQGKPLFHIASIKAEEIKPLSAWYSADGILPNLSFYLDMENTEQGWPEEPDRFKVLNYVEQAEVKGTRPDDEPAFRIFFEEQLDLPSYDHSLLRVLDLTDEERGRYGAFEETFKMIVRREDGETNKLFGYPNNVQHCVAYEAERIKSAKGFSDDIYEDAVEWQLLLQVPPYAHWFRFFDTFGDGAIYYMIRKADLQRGNFDDVQVVVQNT